MKDLTDREKKELLNDFSYFVGLYMSVQNHKIGILTPKVLWGLLNDIKRKAEKWLERIGE